MDRNTVREISDFIQKRIAKLDIDIDEFGRQVGFRGPSTLKRFLDTKIRFPLDLVGNTATALQLSEEDERELIILALRQDCPLKLVDLVEKHLQPRNAETAGNENSETEATENKDAEKSNRNAKVKIRIKNLVLKFSS